MPKISAALAYARLLDACVPTWRAACKLPKELLTHALPGTSSQAFPDSEATCEEEEEQSFEMGPAVSRLSVDRLTAEEEAQRNEETAAIILATERQNVDAVSQCLESDQSSANHQVRFAIDTSQNVQAEFAFAE
jgi:hypothetical protein